MLRLFDVTKSYSFEIASTKEKGIRYILILSSEDAQKMGLEKKSNALPILIGAVVVIIGFLVYRKLKKKK